MFVILSQFNEFHLSLQFPSPSRLLNFRRLPGCMHKAVLPGFKKVNEQCKRIPR